MNLLKRKIFAYTAKTALVFASAASLAGTPIETQRIINRLNPNTQFFFRQGRDQFNQEIQLLLRRARFASDKLPISEEWITQAKPLSLEGRIIVSDIDDLKVLGQF